MVMFYDGDPDQGGTAFDVELLAHVQAGRPHLLSVPYRPRTCGARQIVIIANRGKVDEARTTIPLMASCDSAVSTPTTTPAGAATPTASNRHGSSGGCAVGSAATWPSVFLLIALPVLCAVRARQAARARRASA